MVPDENSVIPHSTRAKATIVTTIVTTTYTVGADARMCNLGQLSTGVVSCDDPTFLREGALPIQEIPRELISELASLPVSRNVSVENFTSPRSILAYLSQKQNSASTT